MMFSPPNTMQNPPRGRGGRSARRWLLATAFVFSLGAPAPAWAAPFQYTIRELGILAGTASQAYGINDHGIVVGQSTNATGDLRAVIWDTNGVPTDLGTLGGASSQAFAINNLGEIVGRAARADGRRRAFHLDGAGMTMTELPTLGGQAASGTEDGTGFGINEHSVVSGHARDAAGQLVAFTWTATGGIISLGTPGGSNGRSWDINESGQIAGWGRDGANALVGYRWTPGTGFELIAPLLLGDEMFAVGVNDGGKVAGAAQQTGRSRAWIWDGTSTVDLGTPSGFAAAAANLINNQDQVVGVSYRIDPNNALIDATATLWDEGLAFNLNDFLPQGSGWYLQNARDINDAGQIVGWGTLNGVTRGFLLTPVPTPSSLAPWIMASIALVVSGLVVRRPDRRRFGSA